MKFLSKVLNFLGFKDLVKFSDKRLDQLNIEELEWLVSDFLEKRYDRFDIAALEEFLNEEIFNDQVSSFQKDILDLEAKVCNQNEPMGLWSPKAKQPLQLILREIRCKLDDDKLTK